MLREMLFNLRPTIRAICLYIDKDIVPVMSVNQVDKRSWALGAMHGLNRFYCRAYHDVRVSGVCRVPRTGPAIVMSNHISGLDPMVIQSLLPRTIVWMMAREYYEMPVLGRLYRQMGAIAVSRDGKDSSALRAALRALDKGNILGVFPEGRISTGRELLPIEPGLAMIALRSGATVHPIFQTGTSRGQSITAAVLKPQSVRVHFGAALTLNPAAPTPGRKNLNSASASIQLAELLQRTASEARS